MNIDVHVGMAKFESLDTNLTLCRSGVKRKKLGNSDFGAPKHY